ncbi:MAG: PAS domain-containing sensor histidine kinase [Burkholderiales bacterium]|nr:PAS domain-containing sensor histidine kinase [Burkholderiales bacterium]
MPESARVARPAGLSEPPRWFTPTAVAIALGVVAALVILNVAVLVLGEGAPWLRAVDAVADLALLAAGAVLFVRLGLSVGAETARMRVALDEATTRLGAIVETAMDPIITVDDAQRIVLFNRAAEQAFGCSRADAIGAPLERFIPARFRDAHRRHVEAFGRTGITNRRMGENDVLWALRADDSEFPIEASISQTGVGEGHFYTVILRDITRRKNFEDALRRQQEELRELSARVIEAREEEKTLIARELHDELGQLLTALKMDVAWLRERLPADAHETAQKIEQMNAVLDRTVGSVRRISADLRPLMLDDLGLADAAGWLVGEFARHAGVECTLEIAPGTDFGALERSTANAVYRALQESLTNVARHARAKHAWVMLRVEDGSVQLEVEDDGRGIDPEDVAKPRSLGLKGMRERALYLGGSCEVSRAPRGGTRLRLRVPLSGARESAA